MLRNCSQQSNRKLFERLFLSTFSSLDKTDRNFGLKLCTSLREALTRRVCKLSKSYGAVFPLRTQAGETDEPEAWGLSCSMFLSIFSSLLYVYIPLPSPRKHQMYFGLENFEAISLRWNILFIQIDCRIYNSKNVNMLTHELHSHMFAPLTAKITLPWEVMISLSKHISSATKFSSP